jgi:hypothetical protein
MQLYANPNRPDHAENNAAFLRVVNDYPGLSLFQPSPEKAPWHWQAVIDLGGDVQLINFWPHTLKGQRDGYKAIQGEAALRGIIEQAFIDAERPAEYVIEDCA